uniref:Uncharacterized protein n=1 Tax=Spongospora subterranea TaxID=70186 RepID=A0A0H5QYA7_9EUKA|eukprot:CRZ06704.1 hypothetical protein [Spongospora subterranea]
MVKVTRVRTVLISDAAKGEVEAEERTLTPGSETSQQSGQRRLSADDVVLGSRTQVLMDNELYSVNESILLTPPCYYEHRTTTMNLDSESFTLTLIPCYYEHATFGSTTHFQDSKGSQLR